MSAKIEIVIFRYIKKEYANDFLQRMSDGGITLPTFSTQSSSKSGAKSEPSAPIELWDYPSYMNERIVPSKIVDIVKQKDLLSLVQLNNCEVVHIKGEPEHYPFKYILNYQFEVKLESLFSDFLSNRLSLSLPQFIFEYKLNISQSELANDAKLLDILNQLKSKDLLYDLLTKATDDIKKFTDEISSSTEAPYRPVYWFICNLTEELHGLRGIVETLLSPDGKKCKIERGFPNASYIVYDICPSQNNIRFTDLGLVSVIASMTERGYRLELYEITQSILEEARKYASQIGNQETIESLKKEINRLASIQANIRPKVDDFYKIRKNLIRSRGLVRRVKQICGGENDKTIFDIVCDDAMNVITDEVEMSQEEIANTFKGVNDQLSSVYSQLNNKYGNLNVRRSQNLQELGYLLQATGVGYSSFQISNTLMPANAKPLGLPRESSVVLITILSFFITLIALFSFFQFRNHNP